MALEDDRDRMIETLKRRGAASDPRVYEVLRRVPRHRFVPEDRRGEAYRDTPLQIGQGQTISAPHMVAMMLDALELEPGQRVLEVGTGSGYHTACTWELVRPGGRVDTVERLADLADRARTTLREAGYGEGITIGVRDGTTGWPEHAPYDRIYVTAGAPKVPDPLVDQLADGGVLLLPVGSRGGQKLIRVRRRGGDVTEQDLGGCAFVPLKGEHGW